MRPAISSIDPHVRRIIDELIVPALLERLLAQRDASAEPVGVRDASQIQSVATT